MTRLEQLVHVAWKDLRMAKWFVAGYVLTVAAAVANLLVPAPRNDIALLLSMCVAVLAMVLTALIVHADSSFDPKAFWVSLPLEPVTLLLAKLAVIAVVMIGAALAGKVVLLLAHDVSITLMPRLVVETFLILAILVVPSLVVLAAVTPDLRMFFIVLVAVLIAQNTLVAVVVAMTDAEGMGRYEWWMAAVLLLLLARQYMSRDRRVMIAGLVVVCLVSSGAAVFRDGPVDPPTRGKVPPSLLAGVVIDSFHVFGDEAQADVRIEGGSPEHAYFMVGATAIVQLRDGTSLQMRATSRSWLNTPEVSLAEDLEWFREQLTRPAVRFRLSPDQRQALSQGFESVILSGHIDVLESTVRSSTPLRAGETVVRRGHRLRTDSVMSRPRGIVVRLAISQIDRNPYDAYLRENHGFITRYALVDHDRRRAVRLNETGRSGAAGLIFGASWHGTATLTTVPMFASTDSPERNQGWVGSAQLISLDWTPIGSYPLTLRTHSVVQRSARSASSSASSTESGISHGTLPAGR